MDGVPTPPRSPVARSRRRKRCGRSTVLSVYRESVRLCSEGASVWMSGPGGRPVRRTNYIIDNRHEPPYYQLSVPSEASLARNKSQVPTGCRVTADGNTLGSGLRHRRRGRRGRQEYPAAYPPSYNFAHPRERVISNTSRARLRCRLAAAMVGVRRHHHLPAFLPVRRKR